MRGLQRVFTTQLVICSVIGLFLFYCFCLMRYRWPNIYATRLFRRAHNAKIKPLPKRFFGWLSTLYAITDDQVLEFSGLDVYVYLQFFKMGIQIFAVLSVLSVFVLSPVRYYFTGNYDKDNVSLLDDGKPPPMSTDFPAYIWIYPVATYTFSIILYQFVFATTKQVLKVRQKYLASQNSITDRTIRLDGIPNRLIRDNNPFVLKKYIEDLGIGKVEGVKLIYDWTPLSNLMEKRNSLLKQLERLYTSIYGLDLDVYNNQKSPSCVIKLLDNFYNISDQTPINAKTSEKVKCLSKELLQVEYKIRTIQSQYNVTLSTIKHKKIKLLRSAFITMDSVASAQMAAQTVLDPRLYKLFVTLAPAPKDVLWSSFKLTSLEKVCQSYFVTFLIVISYLFVIFLVTPLTTLLDPKTLSKFWPALGELINKSKWATTFVTGVLPPLLFSLINISLPYFYAYLSKFQGYSSNGEVELSTLLKNFFFIFFNLFLVFIVTGTVWDYLSYISDTTKIAYQLAKSLKKLLLFYVNLILLQGLTMFPVRLLQISDFLVLNIIGKLFFFRSLFLRTPRDYRSFYYTPQIFDFGLQLPQHILIFIIILIYSVVLTKIVCSGLVYFVFGYFVYKYQLIYCFVHPPHSSGKVWPMIFRRIMLGLIIFQIFMCGTLALEGAILLLVLVLPLIVITLIVSWHYEKYYLPLNDFIALRAILNPSEFDDEMLEDEHSVEGAITTTHSESTTPSPFSGEGGPPSIAVLDSNERGSNAAEDELNGITTVVDSMSEEIPLYRLLTRRSTIDEERELYADYTYPYVLEALNGPLVGFEGDLAYLIRYPDTEVNDMVSSRYDDGDQSGYGSTEVIEPTDLEIGDGQIVRKELHVAEWE
ncbi:uncharacterized protein KQ657_000240 [Scheffersomyces spartinae]|uniref:DUF221-domain-containing protein n=1 Tax=Scheffersomyces spartinae TaxID=45513 RepID=A0A9P7VEJ9_9ASCO|nr:uncharacterized protein KQ657_000240 [Scheffersomyces spartinae]KAG7196227.1 hypothetical protein KQ657_000240 [Scheffersomyces spartinae]